MINEVSFEVLDIYLKIFLLLYADDTVLMSENVNGNIINKKRQKERGNVFVCLTPTLQAN
jgi:hypothetical protein